MRVTTVHRVRAGREGLAGTPAVRGVPGGLAVDHVGRDRQHRLGGHRVAVHAVAADLRHERLDQLDGDGVDAVVVVAVGGPVALGLVVDDDAALVDHRGDGGVPDGRQRVRGDRQAGDAAGHRAQHVLVVQGHLEPFVRVLVVRPVDAVQRLDVRLGEPVHGAVEAGADVVVVQRQPRHDGGERRRDLLARDLVLAAVDRVQQRLGEVHAGAEELHLLAHRHRRDAARDGRVVAPRGADLLVRLVLDRGRVDRHLGAELLEPLGQPRAPEDRHVRLGRRAQVVQGLQEAERVLRDERAAVLAHAADGLGDPGRVAGEQGVVLGGAQEAHDPELDDEVVDDLLRLGLGEAPGGQVALDVDVEEGRRASQRHRGAVLLLHRGEVAEVQPLHGLARRRRRSGDVVPVGRGHLLELAERTDLLRVLLALPRHGLAERLDVEAELVDLLRRDQLVDAVQGHAAVVADDAAAAVRVRQAGDDVRAAGGADVRRVDVEDALVVRLAVLGEDLLEVLVDRVAVRLQRALDHAPATVRHDRALERGIGLQPDDQLGLAVDVARAVRGDGGRRVRVDVVDTLLPLGREHRRELLPHRGGARGGSREERVVSGVRGVVALDEVAHVDAVAPGSRGETRPGGGRRGCRVGGHRSPLPSRSDHILFVKVFTREVEGL